MKLELKRSESDMTLNRFWLNHRENQVSLCSSSILRKTLDIKLSTLKKNIFSGLQHCRKKRDPFNKKKKTILMHFHYSPIALLSLVESAFKRSWYKVFQSNTSTNNFALWIAVSPSGPQLQLRNETPYDEDATNSVLCLMKSACKWLDFPFFAEDCGQVRWTETHKQDCLVV